MNLLRYVRMVLYEMVLTLMPRGSRYAYLWARTRRTSERYGT